ncbi:hypothetical protein CONLIGDRAFT_718184 [Coniochaeta ligniaria NRRL 30616]|uniref:Cyanovirin-N domain-containing protein n=1 Tax=Coniochaeta ligniaria NRRL 30616 TaxID=1408157 RepID=A0A1J7J834_9PEZI|nr:hypothetical protein CONLIGDRAFT_718184 [Coniochaeta ligniaria NRRL 30616]
MSVKHFISRLAILVVGCALTSASVINRSAGNTSDVAHFFNQCQRFSIGATFNGIPDNGPNLALSAEGSCEDYLKDVVCSYMYLNRCYNFDFKNGLVPANGDGNFYNVCRNCRVNEPLRAGWLFCDCYVAKVTGGFTKVPVEANLEDHLYVNFLGILSCPGNEGHWC